MNEHTVDPMDTVVNDIDTSWPRLPTALYDMKIVKAVKEDTKAKDGERLTITLENTTSATSTIGEPIAVGGVKISHYIGVTEKPSRTENGKTIEAYTKEKIAKNVAALGKAARLAVTPRQLIDNPGQLEGVTVRCKVKINPETPEFPESNKIGEFIVIK